MTAGELLIENIRLNKMIHGHLYAIRGKRVKPNTKGAHSYCYYFGDYVILKNISEIDVDKHGAHLEEVFEEQKEFLNKLKNEQNVNTPELLCCYKGKHHFYKIEERAKGSVLSVHYASTARAIAFNTTVLDNNNTDVEIANESEIKPSEMQQIGYAMYRYNVAMQKQLKEADQRLFNKFVRDFKVLTLNHVYIDDGRSENFLFDKTAGFSFVDLEVGTAKYSLSDLDITRDIFSAFADFKSYLHYMTYQQQKTILQNHEVVMCKVLEALKQNHFNLTKEQWEYYEKLAKNSKEQIATISKEFKK